MNAKTLKRAISIAHIMCPINREMRTSHVAFLIKKGKIVHVGWNKNKTHPENLNHPYHDGRTGLHAELDVCLKSGLEDLSTYEMIVIRVDRLGRMCNSRPCNGCQSIINQMGIKKVWYSNIIGRMQEME